MVNLTTLAPGIVEAIFGETLPPELTLLGLAVDPRQCRRSSGHGSISLNSAVRASEHTDVVACRLSSRAALALEAGREGLRPVSRHEGICILLRSGMQLRRG